MRKTEKQLLWLACLIAFTVAIWIQSPRLVDLYQAEDDFRVYYWMHRFQNEAVFPHDVLVFSRIHEFRIGDGSILVDTASPVYSALFHIGSYFVPIILFGKLLVFPLTLMSVAYLYGIGLKLSDARTAFILCLLFVVVNFATATAVSTIAGLQRSFVFPLLLALLYYLITHRYRAAAVVILLSGLIYPTAFILACATYGLLLLRQHGLRWPIAWRAALPLVTAVVAVLMTLLSLMILPSESLDATVPEEQRLSDFQTVFEQSGETVHILRDPYYQPGARGELFVFFPLTGRGGLTTQGMSFIFIAALAIIALAIWLFHPASWRELNPVLSTFFIASWICFGLAWLLILITSSFPLYFPSRYTEASLILFFLIFIAINGTAAFQKMVLVMQQKPRIVAAILFVTAVLMTLLTIVLFSPPPASTFATAAALRWPTLIVTCLLAGLTVLLWFRPSVQVGKTEGDVGTPIEAAPTRRLLSGMGVFFLALVAVLFISFFKPGFYKATAEERALFAYLESLPADVQLAGAPRVLDNVPLFAKRQVLLNCKMPTFEPDLVLPVLQAYYAPPEEKGAIADFCRAYGVDYLVVDERNFATETLASQYCSFAPYDEAMAGRIQQQPAFALAQITPDQKLFQANHLSVVACSSIDVTDE